MAVSKRLYRSRQDSIIAGVCGGLGDYFDIDPTFLRILFIAMAFAFGATLVLYILMWLIVPLSSKS